MEEIKETNDKQKPKPIKKTENHYHKNQYVELPKVKLSYSDSNRSIEIEATDYTIDNAFDVIIYILDKRVLSKEYLDKDNSKDNSISG